MHDTQKQWLQLGNMANRRCDAGLLSTTSRHIPHVLFISSSVFSGLAPMVESLVYDTPALNEWPCYIGGFAGVSELLDFFLKKNNCIAPHPACGCAQTCAQSSSLSAADRYAPATRRFVIRFSVFGGLLGGSSGYKPELSCMCWSLLLTIWLSTRI